MPQFVLFLDEVGAEAVRARTSYKEVYVGLFSGRDRFRPRSIRPVDISDHKTTARRAATGYLLAGAEGAAAGVLMGKGRTVLFELERADGSTRRGTIDRKRYPAMRKAIERMQRYRPGDERRRLVRFAAYLALATTLEASMRGGGFFIGLIAAYVCETALDRRKLALPA